MKLAGNKWAVLGWLAAGQIIGKCKQNALDTLHIYGAAAYLKGVHFVRDLYLQQIGIFACILFLAGGVMLMEGGAAFLFFHTPEARAAAVFAAGVFNTAAGLICLSQFVSSKRWLDKAVKHNPSLESLIHEEHAGSRNGRFSERRTHSRPLRSVKL